MNTAWKRIGMEANEEKKKTMFYFVKTEVNLE